MPFEVAPITESPAVRLARLIEMGVAANPDIKWGRGRMLTGLHTHACALGFAALGMGMAREQVATTPGPYVQVSDAVGMDCWFVWEANDHDVRSLPQLVNRLYGRKPPTAWYRVKSWLRGKRPPQFVPVTTEHGTALFPK